MTAAVCPEVLFVTVVDQRIEAFYGFNPDVAAITAIAAIGATIFDIGLASE